MQIKWNGPFETLVRINAGEEKTTLQPGETIEVSDKKADELLRYSRDFQVVTGDVKAEKVQKGLPNGFLSNLKNCKTLDDFKRFKKEVLAIDKAPSPTSKEQSVSEKEICDECKNLPEGEVVDGHDHSPSNEALKQKEENEVPEINKKESSNTPKPKTQNHNKLQNRTISKKKGKK